MLALPQEAFFWILLSIIDPAASRLASKKSPSNIETENKLCGLYRHFHVFFVTGVAQILPDKLAAIAVFIFDQLL